ncbi:MAG: hypothetical protein AM324_008560 [Candidatus Thorarchaeota archaeon SMTZ1-83]|nr:MAG: hypothetical protein AM324_09890 [Candidatus Thorarchaeota archaeon SMTZ1-83]
MSFKHIEVGPLNRCVKCGVEIDDHQSSHFVGRCAECFTEWETLRTNARLSGVAIIAMGFLFLVTAMQWGIGFAPANEFLLLVAGTIAFGLAVFLWARGELSQRGSKY